MAKKKTAKKPAAPKSAYHHYVSQRDQFYRDHQYAKYLLAALAIAFSIYIGVQVRNIRATQYVMLQLLEEGIDPASVGITR